MTAHVTQAKMRVLDLFSGIGGFSLGLERTGGFETVAFCEVEDFPRAVLAKHWPDLPCFPDVRKLKGADIDGPVDVICGGYPCQPFSTAGRRRGAEDDRHLWPEFNRLVAELRPTWVIGENVAGHISMGIDSVLSDLEGQGYACRAFVIPACAVDAPHRRDRVWTVAYAGGKQHKGGCDAEWRTPASGLYKDVAHAAQLQRNGGGEHRQQGCGQVPELGKRSGAEPLADTLRLGQQRSGQSVIASDPAAARQGQTDHAFAISQPGKWRPEPNVGRVAARISQKLDGDRLDVGLVGAESGAESGEPGWKGLRGLRSDGQTSEAPSRLQQAYRSDDSLPDVPRSGRHCRWHPQNEADEALQAVWRAFYADAQQESQSLWPSLPVGDGPDQRFETLAWGAEPNIPRVALGVPNRVSRLKALGNAVVPQIPEMIGRAILAAEAQA